MDPSLTLPNLAGIYSFDSRANAPVPNLNMLGTLTVDKDGLVVLETNKRALVTQVTYGSSSNRSNGFLVGRLDLERPSQTETFAIWRLGLFDYNKAPLFAIKTRQELIDGDLSGLYRGQVFSINQQHIGAHGLAVEPYLLSVALRTLCDKLEADASVDKLDFSANVVKKVL